MSLSRRIAVTAFCVLAANLPAQSTLIVGPGGFAQIDPAIQAAVPGDTIRITVGGRLDPFTLDRGITLRADPGVHPIITNAPRLTNFRDTLIRVPSGQVAEITGLRFRPELLTWLHAAVRIQGGTVRLIDCEFESKSLGCGHGVPALEVDGATVALQLCRLFGRDRFGIGLYAIRSTVSATDSVFEGGSGCWDSLAYSAEGIVLGASSLHGCRLEITGGSPPSLNPHYPGAAGVGVAPDARLWLSDSVVTGGSSSSTRGTGGDAIDNRSIDPVVLRDVTLVPGGGRSRGVAVSGPFRTEPELVSIWSLPELGPTLGANWTVHARAAASTWVAVGYSTRLGASPNPLGEQFVWLAPGGSGPEWITRRSDAQGRLDESLAIPNSPAFRHQSLFAQCAALGTASIQLSPVVGGQLR